MLAHCPGRTCSAVGYILSVTAAAISHLYSTERHHSKNNSIAMSAVFSKQMVWPKRANSGLRNHVEHGNILEGNLLFCQPAPKLGVGEGKGGVLGVGVGSRETSVCPGRIYCINHLDSGSLLRLF
jgi:hypothetical protein